MRILHIANWYPNQWEEIEGIFVKEHFKVFSKVTDGHMLNIQVRNGERLFEYKHINYSNSEEGYYILTKIKSNKIIEILTTLLLIWGLLKSDYKKYDLLHFHIAYPLLSYYSWWKRLIKTPVIILEHWTAYHLNFNLPKNTNKLDRIKKIFRQKIPVITVSKALLEDIQKFSGANDFPSRVIPNVINKQHNRNKKNLNKVPVFFIVNIWRKLKNPFIMLEAFSSLAIQGKSFELRIGGYGELLDDMKKFVKYHKLESQTIFLEKMDSQQIENELNSCDAYLFSSKYETFSVACADALTCGCPLIGPPIPCILEYTSPEEIVTIDEDSATEWKSKLKYFMEHQNNYNNDEIAKKAKNYFSNKNIQDLYIGFLNESF